MYYMSKVILNRNAVQYFGTCTVVVTPQLDIRSCLNSFLIHSEVKIKLHKCNVTVGKNNFWYVILTVDVLFDLQTVLFNPQFQHT
jgi:hypothetical protein